MHVLSVRHPPREVKRSFTSSTIFSQQSEGKPLVFNPGSSTPRRQRIWQLNSSYHCSVIGTCLSTADVRDVLERLNLAGAKSLSDHDIHKYGVTLAGQSDGSAKMLQKALDRRHQQCIKRFDKAKSNRDIERLWDESVRNGDIPGAYWAVLTHPLSDEGLQKKAFGEVHMLSHLVGAANRADIRRLRELEAENSELRGKVERQQAQIREAVLSRDSKLNELSTALARAVSQSLADQREPIANGETLANLVARLERKLATETARLERSETRLRLAEERQADAHAGQLSAEQRARDLENELEAVDVMLRRANPVSGSSGEGNALTDQTILYVGGRTGSLAELQSVARRFSVALLHHDGGMENQMSQIAGLISRSAVVFFPVDCVSHTAMQLVKRLSRQAGKPYVPLRSSGLTCFVAALNSASTFVNQNTLPGAPISMKGRSPEYLRA